MRLLLNKLKTGYISAENKITSLSLNPFYVQVKTVVLFIFIHMFIVFFAMYFLINLLSGVIFSILIYDWYFNLMNLLGAGCLYYLLIDFIKFIQETFKKEGK